MRAGAAWLVAGVLALPLQAAHAQADEARDWLERMSQALAERNYEGLFTHSTPGRTESMRIVHRAEQGRSLERLVSLDGSGREVVRTRE
ncbi:MAG TPA: sigma-E factor regulatory protein RseB domain-containing protein, partial [Steroidobacteraceae bacterium]|nr:sigma-E factor regulatory protein RseB domain-containing protein [Steroidobacteraceae bacterium]